MSSWYIFISSFLNLYICFFFVLGCIYRGNTCCQDSWGCHSADSSTCSTCSTCSTSSTSSSSSTCSTCSTRNTRSTSRASICVFICICICMKSLYLYEEFYGAMSETTKHAGTFHLYPNLIKAETDRGLYYTLLLLQVLYFCIFSLLYSAHLLLLYIYTNISHLYLLTEVSLYSGRNERKRSVQCS